MLACVQAALSLLPTLRAALYAQWRVVECSTEWRTRRIRRSGSVDSAHLCVAVLSSTGRPALLRSALESVFRHLNDEEPGIRTQVVWVDNGSDPADTAGILSRYEHLLSAADLHATNCGLSHAVNTLYFSLCTAPYVLILEEDWLFQHGSQTRHVFQRAMDVLSFAPADVSSVYLRPENDAVHTLSEWRKTPALTEFRLRCASDAGGGWGAYTNGPSLMRRTTLLSVGRMARDDPANRWAAENDYSARMFARGMCGAELRLNASCDSSACNAAFVHMGERSSPSWQLQ